jgi:Peptidase A4 family
VHRRQRLGKVMDASTPPNTLLALALTASLAMPAGASPIPFKAAHSVNWSGYALAGSAFTGVTGTFNVPVPLKSASCLEETSVWVGIDGVNNRDLLQAGIVEEGFTAPSTPVPTDWPTPAVPPVLCGGRVQVSAWWEDLPAASVRANIPVRVGDSVTVSIFRMSPGWWAITIHDVTSKRSFLLAQPYHGPQSSVEWVVEAPQVVDLIRDPLPINTVDFRDLSAQGMTRRVERFTFGSGRYFASPSSVASLDQLVRTGFAVSWAGTEIPH